MLTFTRDRESERLRRREVVCQKERMITEVEIRTSQYSGMREFSLDHIQEQWHKWRASRDLWPVECRKLLHRKHGTEYGENTQIHSGRTYPGIILH
jgi:hypothetical protein